MRKTPQWFGRVGRIATLTLPWLLTGAARGDDWSRWRGPNRDGTWHETGILESFPSEGLKIRWRGPVGWGWSSPVVAQGRVFVTDSKPVRPVAKERVHCFEEASGELLWTYAYEATYPDWAFDFPTRGGPIATPIVEAGKVYTLGASGHVYCLGAHTGELLWEKNLGKEYQVRVLECRASPLLEGELLIVCPGGKPGACVVALDKDSGKEVWKALDERMSNSSPIIIVAGGKRQLIVWTTESISSLDPATGEVYWRKPLLTSSDDAVSSPVFHDNLLLISGVMLELETDNPAASFLWPAKRPSSKRILSNTSTALFQGDHLFSARSSGELVCLKASTGEEVWETGKVTDLKGGASIHMAPTGEVVFLFNDKGELILARLTAKGYEEISRALLLEPTFPHAGRKCLWTPPAYANRHVFVRNDEELICTSLAAKP